MRADRSRPRESPETRQPAGTSAAPVVRSPADVLRLVVAAGVVVLLLVVEWLFGDSLVAFTSDLLRGLDAIPTWLVDVIVVGTRVLAVIMLGGGLVHAVLHSRWRMLLTVTTAGLLAAAVTVIIERLVTGDHGDTSMTVGVDLAPLSDSRFPTTAGLAATAAVLTAAAPWLNRRWRRAAWALVVGLMVTRFLATAVGFDTLSAFLLGWLSGSAVLVALGAPSRRPTVTAVIAGLADVGVPVQTLEPASVDARGSTPYFGVADDGSKLFVKVLGNDERSADVLFRMYRRLLPRDFGDERPFSSLRRSVEHEALLALAANQLGVRTPQLRAFAAAEPHGYVLAYAAIEGRSLDRLEPEEFDDDVLGAIWTLVSQLQGHRVAHRDLRLANIFRDDGGQVWLIDFGFSELAASDLLLATDVAELIASSSLEVGAERAVDHALRAVDDPARLRLAASRLQPWALSGATRTAHKRRPGLIDELRQQVETAVASASTPA